MKRGSLFPFLIMILLVLPGCKTKKNISGNTCQTIGLVKDYTGLDGCKMLIELEDGRKFLPARLLDENFQLRDNQKVAFDYRELKDYGMTICMAEDMIVEITCIRELEP